MSDVEGRETWTGGRRTVGTAFLAALALWVSWTVIGATAEAVGPGMRAVAMVHVETSPDGSIVAFDDASEEAAAFLIDRDSVSLEVPWTMSVDRLLQLYHLENNQSVKLALEAQLGVVDPNLMLVEGTRLRFALTPSEGGAR